ncbi:MAG: PadR family transcriptional regulator [Candidatus Cloacimonetes bacterium]|nr:PadR family transcriptional regulator [Candidatus Cloacimonadota bacterium]
MNKNELIILGLLNEKPSYGYELKNTIRERNLDKLGLIKEPSIYSTLNKLEREKKITGEKNQYGNMPPSTIYSLTNKGKKSLKENVEQALNSKKIPANPHILGIAFINGTSQKNAIKILKNNLEHIENRKKLFLEENSKINELDIPFNKRFLIEFANEIQPIVKRKIRELIKEIENTDESFFYQNEEKS